MKITLYFLVSILVGVYSILFLPDKVNAVSSTVVIGQLQAGKSGFASEEFVLLRNQSLDELNVTNWCVQYSSSNTINLTTNDVGFADLACILSPELNVELWVPAGGTISFASIQFVDRQNEYLAENGMEPTFNVDFVFSAGMAGLDRHIRVVDALGHEVDRVGWGAAARAESSPFSPMISGEMIGRDFLSIDVDTDNNLTDFSPTSLWSPVVLSLYEVIVPVYVCSNIEPGLQVIPDGYLADEDGNCFKDFCPNIDGLQVVAPEGYEKKAGSIDCTEIPLEDAVLFITELLPDAPSVDTGQEFIEFYNPNDVAINLAGYKLQLGPGFTKEFVFAEGMIESGQYLTFSDTFTGIVLPNATGQQLRLIAPAGNTVSTTQAYINADDDVSWALVEDIWIFTNQITPGAPNKPYLEPVVDEVLGVTSVLAPCPAGKFRNPETNRCKFIETAVSQLTPCDEDEFRNPETNRCKKNSSSSSSLSPCAEGQERNPETNRCRTITTIGITDESGLPEVTDLAIENIDGQINWLVISSALLGTLTYMVYEWRNELSHHIVRMKQRLVQ